MKIGPVILMITATALRAQTNPPPVEPEPIAPPPTAAATNEPAVKAPDEIFITSEHGELHYKTNTVIYRDNVAVDDPQMKLRCDLLTLEAPKVPSGKFNRATAEGNVVVDFLNDGATNHVTAGKVVYTYSITNSVTNAVVVVSGNPVITTPSGRYESDPIIWDRIRGTVQWTNRMNMQVRLSGTNSPGLFAPARPNQIKTNSTQ